MDEDAFASNSCRESRPEITIPLTDYFPHPVHRLGFLVSGKTFRPLAEGVVKPPLFLFQPPSHIRMVRDHTCFHMSRGGGFIASTLLLRT